MTLLTRGNVILEGLKYGDFVIIEGGTTFGKNVEIGDFVKIASKSKIGNDVVIGSYVRTGKKCVIGNGVKVKAGAIISPDTVIGSDSFIGPSVTILHATVTGKHLPCTFGEGVYIGAGAIVAPGVNLVSGTVIGAGSFVRKSTTEPGLYAGTPAKKIKKDPSSPPEPGLEFNSKSALIHPTTVIGLASKIGYFCKIRPDVEIGANVDIRDHCHVAEAAKIGDDAKIFQYSNIGAGSVVGKGVYIGPRCTLTNDKKLVHLRGEFKPEPVTLKAYCRLGACVCVLPGVTIGENSAVGAGSIVVADVPKNEIWAGNPAKKIGDVDKNDILGG